MLPFYGVGVFKSDTKPVIIHDLMSLDVHHFFIDISVRESI